MGLLDKAKAAAEQAAAKAKEGAEELQTKRALWTAYGDLGKLTVELVDRGEVSHPELETKVAEIRRLRAESNGDGDAETAAPATSEQPPAMPT
jgi:hypothetical protein